MQVIRNTWFLRLFYYKCQYTKKNKIMTQELRSKIEEKKDEQNKRLNKYIVIFFVCLLIVVLLFTHFILPSVQTQ